VAPDHSATCYGYLELGAAVGCGRKLNRFKEKPDTATAGSFFAAGPQQYLWNSGMFVWQAKAFLDALDHFAPTHAPTLRAMGAAAGTPAFARMATEQ
jgi:mannose-1-phosphate guanylyltransferase